MKENQEILMHGKFSVCGMDSNYTSASAEDGKKRITAVYAVGSVCVDEKDLDILNASNGESVVFECARARTAKTFNCLGELIENQTLGIGITKVALPFGGRVEVR